MSAKSAILLTRLLKRELASGRYMAKQSGWCHAHRFARTCEARVGAMRLPWGRTPILPVFLAGSESCPTTAKQSGWCHAHGFAWTCEARQFRDANCTHSWARVPVGA